jgi:hypothetical protein
MDEENIRMSSSSLSEKAKGNVEKIDKSHKLWGLLKIGSHISRPIEESLNIFKHHGVVYDKNEDGLCIAEFNDDSKVRRISLENFIRSSTFITIRNYDKIYELANSVEIKEKLNKHLRDQNEIYDVTTNNCEIFVLNVVSKNYNEYKKYIRTQVSDAKDIAFNMVCRGIICYYEGPIGVIKSIGEMHQKVDENSKNMRPVWIDVPYSLKKENK